MHAGDVEREPCQLGSIGDDVTADDLNNVPRFESAAVAQRLRVPTREQTIDGRRDGVATDCVEVIVLPVGFWPRNGSIAQR
ncbi:hypothetical protein GCM10009556_092830 [Acrocarpospora pleiomorpha]